MSLIYEDIAKELLTPDRVVKYQKWVEEAEKARKTGSLNEKENQYDKAEELITFYTFAPFVHKKVPNQLRNKIVQEILSSIGINESIKEVEIGFEKDLPPPNNYLKWLKNEVKHHPIRYIRKDAKTKKRLEGYTPADVIIKTDKLLILIEVKFTSDISPYTKFGSTRNQIARLIDVGISEAQKLHKKLVVLICTPSELFERRSRLYYYKIREYSETSNIQKDIPWRTINDIDGTLLKAAWISLERIIETVYRNAKRNVIGPREFEEVKRFFEERMLLVSV